MRIIGITGSSGAGKTSALHVLAGLGAQVIDADQVYHRLLEESEAMRGALRGAFGEGIFDGAGAIDRKKLACVVFSTPESLVTLNATTHPLVLAEIKTMLAAARQEGESLAAIDAIALVESGLGALCDCVVGVLAPVEVRIARIMRREGIGEARARQRVLAQKDEAYFRSVCDHILMNDDNGGLAAFEEKAKALFYRILSEFNTQKEASHMAETEKTFGDRRREALCYRQKNAYDTFPAEEEGALEEYCEGYKKFLDAGKTERECVEEAVRLAEEAGFKPLARGVTLAPGDKVYRVNRGKALMLAVIGKQPLERGVNIAAAHIDSPRLDIKQNPLYEDSELAFLKTHYYGGIRKYHWVAIPLELHGVVVRQDGSTVKVCIGTDPGEPRFTVDDLLPHLATEQSKKPLGEAIPAESLNILVGSRPFRDDEGSDRVKLAVLELLCQKYGMVEEDFISAELSAVPAFPASDIGFDRSLIGAYGQDDRVCAYAALAALLKLEMPRRTAVCMLADKEEIGSEGVSGMKSASFDTFMSDLCDSQRIPLKACYEKSFCLSADVCAAFDPNFPEVYERRNSALINYGMSLCKYTGSRGKSGASDASAEVVGYARRVLTEAGAAWQMAELGKADAGGGGTVAVYMAERDIDTLDAGVPVLSMHAPYETVSKLDCYMTCKGIKAIYEA